MNCKSMRYIDEGFYMEEAIKEALAYMVDKRDIVIMGQRVSVILKPTTTPHILVRGKYGLDELMDLVASDLEDSRLIADAHKLIMARCLGMDVGVD